jgi:hypothetical protein
LKPLASAPLTVLLWGERGLGPQATAELHFLRLLLPADDVGISLTLERGKPIRCSDFTDMGSAGVTITGQPLDHGLYHFRLAYLRQRATPPAFPLKT